MAAISAITKPLSGLFGAPSAPTPVAAPASPMADPDAQAKRLATERAAVADQKARGRASLDVAGSSEAEMAQQERGAFKAKRRASAELLG